jgi:hypothetical protein
MHHFDVDARALQFKKSLYITYENSSLYPCKYVIKNTNYAIPKGDMEPHAQATRLDSYLVTTGKQIFA